MKRLNHPFIIKYYDSFNYNNIVYMVMEYASNGIGCVWWRTLSRGFTWTNQEAKAAIRYWVTIQVVYWLFYHSFIGPFNWHLVFNTCIQTRSFTEISNLRISFWWKYFQHLSFMSTRMELVELETLVLVEFFNLLVRRHSHQSELHYILLQKSVLYDEEYQSWWLHRVLLME